MEAFSGSQADLEGAAENLLSSPPRPQHLRFESLSLKTPQTVPPTPGTALQNKIESRLEKSLGSQFNIQLQQMGAFQTSMLEAFIIISSRNNLKGCVQKPENILTKGSIRYRQSIILSRLLQRKMSPLSQLKSLQNLNKRLLPSLNIRIAQIQSSTGR